MADVGQLDGAERAASALEAAYHFMSVGIVGRQVDDALAELREGVTRHGTRGQMRIERLVEGIHAPVLGLVDGVRLADRVEQDLAVARNGIDRQLGRRRERTNDELDLVLFDQLERPGRGFAGIELVVAHQQLGHAAIETAGSVEVLDGDFSRTHLVLRLG